MTYFTSFGLSGSNLLSKTNLGLKVMIDRLWVCETHAQNRVILVARPPQGKGGRVFLVEIHAVSILGLQVSPDPLDFILFLARVFINPSCFG